MKNLKLLIFILLIVQNIYGQNTNVSQGNAFDGEPYLAVNPNNTQHIVIGWMGFVPFNQIVIKTKVSEDGGDTWSSVEWIPHNQTGFGSADPIIEFDNSGNVYVFYIDFSSAMGQGAVFCRKSTDGGYNWGTEVEVINVSDDGNKAPVDRPWVAIDKTGGTNDGNIYVTSMNGSNNFPVAPPYHPYFVRSTDGGLTFEPWKYLDGPGWLAGNFIPLPMPAPTVGADGDFHAVYPSFVLTQNPQPQFIMASSSDGGDNFSYQTAIISSETVDDTLAKKGYLLRGNPADENHLALFYPSVSHGDIDVFMIETFDKGANWNTPIRVNDDPIGNNRMQDLIWADFDNDGDLAVSWRDRRNAGDSTYTTETEIWGAIRDKDSSNFTPNFKISDTLTQHDTILNGSGNDFMCIDFIEDTLHITWGDVRTTRLNIWYQKYSSQGILLSSSNVFEDNWSEISIFPNPADDQITITSSALFDEVKITNTSGQIVQDERVQSPTNEFNSQISEWPSGKYFVLLYRKDQVISKGVFVVNK